MLNQLNPAYVPLLTFLGTLLIVAVAILYNHSRITDFSSRITDVKDLIKAEARVAEAHMRRLEEKTDSLDEKIQRLEQKSYRVGNMLLTRLADHDARIRRLESR